MEPRKKILDQLAFPIPNENRPKKWDDTYCTWGELCETQNIRPNDLVQGIEFDALQDKLVVRILREREETDKEYNDRMRVRENFALFNEKQEREEYLRLKAKYETN